MKHSVLVIDNSPDVCQIIEVQLKAAGFLVRIAYSGEEGLKMAAESKPDLVLTDLQMPGMDGIETMRAIREMYPNQLIVMMTAHGSVESAVEAMKVGAYDYMQKPFEAPRLLTTINNALESQQLRSEVKNLKSLLNESNHSNIIGSSTALKRVLASMRKTYNLDTTVLLLGESGTGKDLIAQTIHENTHNRDRKKFVAVNCAALPETLLESELFGHEKGAFSGAAERKIGKFEFANGGTIFLDEIGEMSPILQAKLLRVLQNKEIQRLGSNQTIPVDIRIIAATNQDIEERVSDGSFREDLYYRLNVFTLYLPPLRERKEDIEELVHHFMPVFNLKLNKEVPVERIAPEVMDAFVDYDWPGNIRQLQNILERSMIEADGDTVELSHLPYHFTRKLKRDVTVDYPIDGESDLPSTIEKLERKLIENALDKFNHNVSDVAKALKIGRTTLYRKAEQYGIPLKK